MELDRVVVEYYRIVSGKGLVRYFRKGKRDFVPETKGGMTICKLILEDGREITGVANCSKKDNFNYRLGYRIAVGRAEKIYNNLVT
jgi:hypothetical protein